MGDAQPTAEETASTRKPAVRDSRLASPTTAVAVGASELALLIIGVTLAAAAHQLTFSVSGDFVAILAFGVVGVLVAGRQPRNPMGWMLLVAAGVFMLSDDASFYSVLDYRLHHGTLPFGPAAVLLQPTWATTVMLFGLLVLVFPNGQLPSRRWRWALRALLVAGVVFQLGSFGVVLGAIVTHNIHVSSGGDLKVIDHPTGSHLWYAYVEDFFFVVLIAIALTWFTRQVPSYRRAGAERRQQLKWFLSGVTIFVISGFLSIALSNSKGILGDVDDATSFGFVAL